MQNQVIETMTPQQVGVVTDTHLADTDNLERVDTCARPDSVDLRLSLN